MKDFRNSDGAVIIIIALLMVIFLGFAALVIDLGIVWDAGKQLQNASDAGALAGARALGYYNCKAQVDATCTSVSGVDITDTPMIAVQPVVNGADGVIKKNSAVGTPSLSASDSDVQVAWWYEKDWHLAPPTINLAMPENAVSVTVRKADGDDNNNKVDAFFGRIFNSDGYELGKNSIAALTGLGSVKPGELVPIGISILACPAPEITLQGNAANNVGCVGWTNLADESHVNANDMRDLAGGSTPSPSAQVGDEIYYTGGVASNVFNSLYSQWVDRRDLDGNWEVLMPVYSEADCTNPTGLKVISGFATMKITKVDCVGSGPHSCVLNPEPHSDVINGTMVCNVVKEGLGGGADFGTFGTIPGLVR